MQQYNNLIQKVPPEELWPGFLYISHFNVFSRSNARFSCQGRQALVELNIATPERNFEPQVCKSVDATAQDSGLLEYCIPYITPWGITGIAGRSEGCDLLS